MPAVPVRGVVIDLDGTCLDGRQRLHPRIRDAVRTAALRMPVIVATGRMYVSALPWAQALRVSQPLVCYEGAMIRALPQAGQVWGAILREEALGADPARRALRVARAHHWHAQVYIDEQLLCEEQRPEAELYARVAGVPVHVVADLEPLLAAGTPKLVCVVLDAAEAEHCARAMRDALHGTARVTQSRPEYVEIVSPAVSKAAACGFVCERLGMSLADCVAVGDAPNDIELLEAAGYAVAVSGARPEVLAYADAVCADPEEGGVADVLEALGLSAAGAAPAS
jgi:Cof subfamily protein (haloacid dehalogenase superfamily)